MKPDPTIPAPIGLLAELTHRCPLQCPYCSNPLDLESAKSELSTAQWLEVIDQAADLGVLQLHLSGGEPTARRDLEAIVARAAQRAIYSNLITSGYGVSAARVASLATAGLDHLQVSIQDAESVNADRIAGVQGAHARKLAVAGFARDHGLALTVNAPIHRQNIDNLEQILALAVSLGAQRVEIANVQYNGWALANRAALMPTRAQVARSLDIVRDARERLRGVLTIDYVAPDYYAKRPKPCMGGWGRGIINITPSGKVLPCHSAETLTNLVFDNVTERPLRDLGNVDRIQRLSRDGLDERALPLLRIQGSGLGRMPLSGAGLDRRCGQCRSHVCQVAVSLRNRSLGRGRGDRCCAGVHLPAPAAGFWSLIAS
jgi:PqqA peptide cyclase